MNNYKPRAPHNKQVQPLGANTVSHYEFSHFERAQSMSLSLQSLNVSDFTLCLPKFEMAVNIKVTVKRVNHLYPATWQSSCMATRQSSLLVFDKFDIVSTHF